MTETQTGNLKGTLETNGLYEPSFAAVEAIRKNDADGALSALVQVARMGHAEKFLSEMRKRNAFTSYPKMKALFEEIGPARATLIYSINCSTMKLAGEKAWLGLQSLWKEIGKTDLLDAKTKADLMKNIEGDLAKKPFSLKPSSLGFSDEKPAGIDFHYNEEHDAYSNNLVKRMTGRISRFFRIVGEGVSSLIKDIKSNAPLNLENALLDKEMRKLLPLIKDENAITAETNIVKKEPAEKRRIVEYEPGTVDPAEKYKRTVNDWMESRTPKPSAADVIDAVQKLGEMNRGTILIRLKWYIEKNYKEYLDAQKDLKNADGANNATKVFNLTNELNLLNKKNPGSGDACRIYVRTCEMLDGIFVKDNKNQKQATPDLKQTSISPQKRITG